MQCANEVGTCSGGIITPNDIGSPNGRLRPFVMGKTVGRNGDARAEAGGIWQGLFSVRQTW